MPCMNFSEERESSDKIEPSLTKWTSISRSSMVTQSLMFRYRRSVFSTGDCDRSTCVEERHHFSECGPARSLCSFNILELLQNVNALGRGAGWGTPHYGGGLLGASGVLALQIAQVVNA